MKYNCKQVPKRNNGLSTDVYCQNMNNPKNTPSSYLYETERRGECTGQRRDRECVCVRVWEQSQIEVGSIVKMSVRRTDHFWISQAKFRQIYFKYKKAFNGKDCLSGL